MKAGEKVRVYPHGSPDQAADGKVILCSENERSIAVAFDHLPPFVFQKAPVVGVHAEHGVVLMAYRHEIGPWIELAGGGHYEIETTGDQV